MNYVRKLGFEESPDYDFLRELFTKVLKTLGEPEDGVYDWMLLNNGKGWEAGHVSSGSSCVARRVQVALIDDHRRSLDLRCRSRSSSRQCRYTHTSRAQVKRRA